MESISSTVMRNICTSQLWDIARAYFSLPSLDFLLWSLSGLTLFAEPPGRVCDTRAASLM